MAMQPRTGHAFDAGTSREINLGVKAVVELTRISNGGTYALVAYRLKGHSFVALATSGEMDDNFTENEPIKIPSFPRLQSAAHMTDFVIFSLVRELQVTLKSAIIVPFFDELGSGAIILGNPTGELDKHTIHAQAVSITTANALRDARQRGSLKLVKDLQAALRDVAAANTGVTDPLLRLRIMIQTVRVLFGTDVAYLATPSEENDVFTFTQTQGIRTKSFKSLRVEEEHGLGGLARTSKHAVSSFEYATDDRLQSAHVLETRREGIISALAAPILLKNHVAGVIYVGERRMRAFTSTDEAIMEDFVGFAALTMEQNQQDIWRAQAARRNARDDLAYVLHDSVVRRLIEIGFMVENGMRGLAQQDATHRQFSTIAETIESAMSALRNELSNVVSEEAPSQVMSAYDVMNQLMSIPHMEGITRSHRENIDVQSSSISAESARALIRVGQEAIFNAGRHSGATEIQVSLDTNNKEATLSVHDNGRGLENATLLAARSGSSHLGIRGMEATAASVGGNLAFYSPPSGGLIVSVSVIRLDRGAPR